MSPSGDLPAPIIGGRGPRKCRTDLCAAEIEYWADELGEAPETECLYVELAVDVGSSEPDDLVLFNGPLTRPDDRFIGIYWWSDPVAPGESSGVGAIFPGGQPGSTVEWYLDTVDEQPGYEEVWDMPEATEFLPITWNPDLGAARAAGSLEVKQG